MTRCVQPSQCDRILAVLSDGLPHSMEEIHRIVGFCRLNSRVAELRTRGHQIVCDKTGGNYIYRLLPAEPLNTPAVEAGALSGAASDTVALPAADRSAGDDGSCTAQLSLEVAA